MVRLSWFGDVLHSHLDLDLQYQKVLTTLEALRPDAGDTLTLKEVYVTQPAAVVPIRG